MNNIFVERMCIACREVQPKSSMLRIVRSDDKISLDFSGKAAGRGAYICNNPDCIKKCTKNKLLNKTFRTQVDNDVYDKIIKEYESRQINEK